MLSVTVNVLAVNDINKAVIECIELAKRMNIIVEGVFDGFGFIVSEKTDNNTIIQICNTYRNIKKNL